MPSTGKAESAKNKKMLGQQVRTAIEALHAENEELKKDLARETRQANLTATMGKGQGSQAARLRRRPTSTSRRSKTNATRSLCWMRRFRSAKKR